MQNLLPNPQIFNHRLFWVTALVTLTTALFLIFYTPLDPLSSPLAYYPLGESGTLELATENRLANREGLSLSLRKLNGNLKWKCQLPGKALSGFNSSQYPITTTEKYAWVIVKEEEQDFHSHVGGTLETHFLAIIDLENGQLINKPQPFNIPESGQLGKVEFSNPFINTENSLLVHAFFPDFRRGPDDRYSRFWAFSKKDGEFLGPLGQDDFPSAYDDQFPSVDPVGWKLGEAGKKLLIAGQNGQISGINAQTGKINFSVTAIPRTATFLPEGIFACSATEENSLLPIKIDFSGKIDTLKWAIQFFDSSNAKPVKNLKNQGSAGPYYLWTGERQLSRNFQESLLFWVDKKRDRLFEVDIIKTEQNNYLFNDDDFYAPTNYWLSDHFRGKERPVILKTQHRKFQEIYPSETVLGFLNPENRMLSFNSPVFQAIQVTRTQEGKYLISDNTSSFVLLNPEMQTLEGVTDIVSTPVRGVPIVRDKLIWVPRENGYYILSFSETQFDNQFSPPIVPDFYPKLVQVHFGLERFRFSF